MRGSGVVEEDFGGEKRLFRIRCGELRKIQETCGTGPGEVARRVARGVAVRRANPKASILDQVAIGLGEWRVDDVREPIFLGLIGGGMAPNDAGKLVREWIDDRGFHGLIENLDLALVLLVAGIDEPEDDRVGEPRPEDNRPPAKARKSRSRKSTASEPS